MHITCDLVQSKTRSMYPTTHYTTNCLANDMLTIILHIQVSNPNPINMAQQMSLMRKRQTNNKTKNKKKKTLHPKMHKKVG